MLRKGLIQPAVLPQECRKRYSQSTHQDFADQIEPGTLLLELGSEALRKIEILLRAIEKQGKRIDYYALDLDRNELARTSQELGPSGYRHVMLHQYPNMMKKLRVDQGAIKFVLSGANIMCPGLTSPGATLHDEVMYM